MVQLGPQHPPPGWKHPRQAVLSPEQREAPRPGGAFPPDDPALAVGSGNTDHLEGHPVLVGIAVCDPGPHAHLEMGVPSSVRCLRSVVPQARRASREVPNIDNKWDDKNGAPKDRIACHCWAAGARSVP